MWQVAVIMAAASIYKGISERNTSRANGRLAQMYADINAKNARLAGNATANAILGIGEFNSRLSMMAGSFNSRMVMGMAEANADMSLIFAQYEADKIRNEVGLMWEEVGLELKQMDNEFKRTRGQMVAGYSASGVELNAVDTPALALMDAETQHEMNNFIVNYGAENTAKMWKHKALESEYMGQIEWNRIMGTAGMESLSIMTNAGMQAASTMADATINAKITRYNSEINAIGIQYGGAVQNAQYRNQGQAAFNAGLVGAATSLATGAMSAYASGAWGGAGGAGSYASTAAAVNRPFGAGLTNATLTNSYSTTATAVNRSFGAGPSLVSPGTSLISGK